MEHDKDTKPEKTGSLAKKVLVYIWAQNIEAWEKIPRGQRSNWINQELIKLQEKEDSNGI